MTDPNIFDEAWRRFDPLVPLPPDDPDHWYEDLSEARGERGPSLVKRLARRIMRPADRPQRLLVLGHPGCGKSTELNRLSRTLTDSGWICVSVAVDRDLDKEDLELPEVQVLIVERVGAVMDAHGIPVDEALLDRIRDWFVEETVSTTKTAGLGAQVTADTGAASKAILLGLLPSFSANMRLSAEQRAELRIKVKKQLRDFVDMVCALLEQADNGLKTQGKQGLLLLIDGLEKASFDVQNQKSRAARILIDQSEQWVLPVPTVITAPLSLLQEKVRLVNHFDEFYLVPAVAVVPRPGVTPTTEDSYAKTGREHLWKLVNHRWPVRELFAEPESLNDLIIRSGGNLRDLFRLIRAALDDAPEGKPIPRAAVESASRRLGIQSRAALQAADKVPLTALLSDPTALHYDAVGVGLLQRELVLPYVNGGEWFGLHPAVREAIESR